MSAETIDYQTLPSSQSIRMIEQHLFELGIDKKTVGNLDELIPDLFYAFFEAVMHSKSCLEGIRKSISFKERMDSFPFDSSKSLLKQELEEKITLLPGSQLRQEQYFMFHAEQLGVIEDVNFRALSHLQGDERSKVFSLVSKSGEYFMLQRDEIFDKQAERSRESLSMGVADINDTSIAELRFEVSESVRRGFEQISITTLQQGNDVVDEHGRDLFSGEKFHSSGIKIRIGS